MDDNNLTLDGINYTAILPLVRQRKTQYFGYAQDEWRVSPSLTVTAGIRYNFFNALHAIDNDDVPFNLLAERWKLRLRADAFNVFNRAQFGAPNADLSQVNFGATTTTTSNYATGRGTPREFQLSANVAF